MFLKSSKTFLVEIRNAFLEEIRNAFLEEIRPKGIRYSVTLVEDIRCFATFVLQHILPFSMELFPIFIKNYP